MSAPDLEALKQAMSGRNYSKAEDLLGEALKKDPNVRGAVGLIGKSSVSRREICSFGGTVRGGGESWAAR